MIGISENKITRVPLVEAVKQVSSNSQHEHISSLFQTQAVATAIENKDFDTACALRDPEFKEMFDGFLTTSDLDPANMLPPHKVCDPLQRYPALIVVIASSHCHYAVSNLFCIVENV
jgi:6-phosphofructokinase 1